MRKFTTRLGNGRKNTGRNRPRECAETSRLGSISSSVHSNFTPKSESSHLHLLGGKNRPVDMLVINQTLWGFDWEKPDQDHQILQVYRLAMRSASVKSALYDDPPIGDNPPMSRANKHLIFMSLHLACRLQASKRSLQEITSGYPTMTCRIDRVVIGTGLLILHISGQITGKDVDLLRSVLEQERDVVAIDLKDVLLVDRGAVRLLALSELNGAELRNCPAYIREWVTRERATINASGQGTAASEDTEGA